MIALVHRDREGMMEHETSGHIVATARIRDDRC